MRRRKHAGPSTGCRAGPLYRGVIAPGLRGKRLGSAAPCARFGNRLSPLAAFSYGQVQGARTDGGAGDPWLHGPRSVTTPSYYNVRIVAAVDQHDLAGCSAVFVLRNDGGHNDLRSLASAGNISEGRAFP